MLYFRYLLLKQGDCPELDPKLKRYIEEHYEVDSDFGMAPIKPLEEVPVLMSKCRVDYDDFESFLKRLDLDDCTDVYVERLLKVNEDKTLAKKLLNRIRRPGVDGILKNIMLYLSTLDRESLSRQILWLSLLTFEDMDVLQTKVNKTYGFDMFTISSFREKYIRYFGDVNIASDADPSSLLLCEKIRRRRIEFLSENGLGDLKEEYLALLRLQTRRGVYDKDLFLTYLKSSVTDDSHIRKTFGYSSYNETVTSFHRDFLRHLFPQEKPDKFLYYLSVQSVVSIYEEQCLLSGKSIKPTMLSTADVQRLNEEKRCRVLDDNKLFYNTGDEVSVRVELKNVSSVQVRVFELNTMSIYKKKDTISAQIDLDGLQPLTSTSYSYSLPSMLSHIETFAFPTLDHRGVYVLDFIAGAINSRFLIRMGSLQALVRTSIAGYALTIVDEFGDRIEKNVKVLEGVRSFTLNDNKEIIIPFLPPTDSSRTVTLLLCQEVQPSWYFVERQTLKLERENTCLTLCGDVDNEDIIKGNEHCRLVLRPVVRLNSVFYPLSLLRNVSITILCEAAQDVHTETTLHPTLKDNQDFTYSFRVLDHVVSLKATMSADIALTNGSLRHLSAECQLYKDSTPSSSIITSVKKNVTFFRRRNSQDELEYVAALYGPAGEPCCGVSTRVELHSILTSLPFVTQLETNEDGHILLGKLKDINVVTVNDTNFYLTKDRFDLPSYVECSESDPVQVMIPSVAQDINSYSLICTKQIDMNDQYGSMEVKDGYLFLSGVPAGSYTLYMTGMDCQQYSLEIDVRRATRPMKIYDSYAVYDTWAKSLITQPLSLSCGLSSSILHIRLQGGSSNRRVHVQCKLLCDSMTLGEHLEEGDSSIKPSVTSLDPVSSIIVNDRSLPEEYAYILDRKRQMRDLPGNMLPHPGPLLHPVEFADTKNITQKAKMGNDFQKEKRGEYGNTRDSGRGGDLRSRAGVTHRYQRSACEVISHPSTLLMNVPLNENGECDLNLDRVSACGAEVTVVGVDETKTVERHLYLEETAKERKIQDLLQECRLKESLDCSKHFTEKKIISLVTEESPLSLDSKSDMETIGSLSDLFLLLKTLSHNSDLDSFSFLLSWEELSEAEKESNYNRYVCSELNVFLFFRDRAFFDAKILPYLRCKMEKSFLDLYLVGADVTSFLQPPKLLLLNAFEKALLCSRIPAEAAKQLADSMGVCGDGEQMSTKAFMRIFNTVLKMKSMENPPSDEETTEVDGSLDEALEEEGDILQSSNLPSVYSPTSPAHVAEDRALPLPKLMGRRRMCGGPISPMMECSMQPQLCCGFAAPTTIPPVPEPIMTPEPIIPPPLLSPVIPPEPRMPPPVMAFCTANQSLRDVDALKEQKRKKESHYELMENTKEYVEGFYYNKTTMYSDPSCVPNSPFWEEFAHYMSSDRSKPFLSKEFIYCTHSFSEILFCMAVLGVKIHNEVKIEGVNEIELYSTSPVFVFHKMLTEADVIPRSQSLIVLQKYIDNNNSFIKVQGEKMERYMTANEFLPFHPYTCKIFITNMESLPQTVSLLYQIPEGSYPLSDNWHIHTESLKVPPYSTSTFSYCFYFPSLGEYKHYPAHVIDEISSEIIGYAQSPYQTLTVVPVLKAVDKLSWRDIAYYASEEDLFAYLRTHSLKEIDWSLMYWRLKDKTFYLSFLNLLRQLGFYNEKLWSYGVVHSDTKTAGEFLSRKVNNKLGLVFESPMLKVESAVERLFQIREYKPFINSRSFRLGKSIEITNDKLKQQYEKFLTLLTQKKPTTDDYLVMVYYFLLLDRVHDALKLFKTRVCEESDGHLVCRSDCRCEIQFDYMHAYFECFSSDLSVARAICDKYHDYPVLYWRNMFANVEELIHDAEGSLDSMVMEEEEAMDRVNLPENVIRSKRMRVSEDSSVNLSMGGSTLSIRYSNVEKVQVNLYEINAELKFSNSPFLKDSSSDSLFIRPNYVEDLQLPAVSSDKLFGTFSYPLPEAWVHKNLLVEVCTGDLRETCFSFNSILTVILSQKSGQLRVFDQTTKRPLSNAYVKVYVKVNEKAEFLKDGFTDIRGYFDYFSVSNDLGKKATAVAIFVDKDGYGSCIRETLPPNTGF